MWNLTETRPGEPGGNFLARIAFGQEVQHLAFPAGSGLDRRQDRIRIKTQPFRLATGRRYFAILTIAHYEPKPARSQPAGTRSLAIRRGVRADMQGGRDIGNGATTTAGVSGRANTLMSDNGQMDTRHVVRQGE